MTFFRWLLFLMFENALLMSHHLLYYPMQMDKQPYMSDTALAMRHRYNEIAYNAQEFVCRYYDSCRDVAHGLLFIMLLLSFRYKWKIGRAGFALILIHTLFTFLEPFDNFTNGNTTVPIIEFAAYFALIGAVIFAKYRYGDRCV